MERSSIGAPDPLLCGVFAVRAGDLLFLSRHIAPDDGETDTTSFRSEGQTTAVFERTASRELAGSSPSQVAELQTFHRGLEGFTPHLAARTRALSPPPPQGTAVEGAPAWGEPA
jgi:enamine deaminase RidA (YjgF/YER057c/UK114 family)